MKIAGKEYSVGAIASVMTIIGMLFGAWFFADGYFVHASDFLRMQQKHQVSKWTFEQSQNDLRMDIIEDRIWREGKQTAPDQNQIIRWRGQVNKIEQRQNHLQQVQDQLQLKSITPRH